MKASQQPGVKSLAEKSLRHTGGAWCRDEFTDLADPADALAGLPVRSTALGLSSSADTAH